MRNLKNLRCVECHWSENTLTASAWDSSTDDLICAFGPSEGDPHITLKRWMCSDVRGRTVRPPKTKDIQDDICTIASWEALSPSPSLPCDKIISLQYFGDIKTTCVVLAGGDILLVREAPGPGEEDIETVGSVDAGITAARWSPDEERLALTTEAQTLLFMTRQFDGAGETIMAEEDLKASKHVSVGWGSAETQFKGKRAKALRDPTMPEKVDEGRLSPHDRGQVTISWRGDGAYVAVSTIHAGQRRVIRVYDRDGTLDSVSEPVDGLEGALSWRPAGNLLAGVQRFPDHVEVVFFERNGLRHGQFDLRLDQEAMNSWATAIELDWNYDSTVLAVSFRDRVQLWTMGNYHYYLKQEIHLVQKQDLSAAISVTWSPTSALRLTIASDAIAKALDYCFDTAAGSTISPNDLGVVAVIDGDLLKLSALRTANIPPPMAACELKLPSPVRDVALSQSGRLVGILRAQEVDVYKWDPLGPIGAPYSLQGRLDLSSYFPDSFLQQIAFVVETELFILLIGPAGSNIINCRLGEQGLHFSEPTVQSPSPVLRIKAWSDHVSLCSENSTRQVYEYHLGMIEDRSFVGQFPEAAPWMECVIVEEKIIAFGLSLRGSLYANKRQLAKSCTSFAVTSAHLIFTTAQHLLKLVHLADVDDLVVPQDQPELDERCRNIERGAKIVTVMPTSYAVVLQMPRGNLETIYPRALVVAGIRDAIDQKDYEMAFRACRHHRVDMNILHDHAPKQFLANLGLFVDQVQKVEYIDLFLSQLREEDVTRTMYQETTPRKIQEQGKSKVNTICDGFLAVLADRMPKHLQNVVTAYVSKSPPDLDAALLAIAKLQVDSPELVDPAVEHICFLSDVNKLYDHALGLYNLDLALLIAQQSQKDPREYLPFLQSLQEMSTARRMYTIDNHLGRYKKALQHLHDMNVFDEFKAYMLRHQLFKAALEMYRHESERFNQIMTLYAEHLDQNSQFKDAGIAYEFVNLFDKATEAYRAAGCWREALSCAGQAQISTSQLQSLAKALADSLHEHKDYFNAARLYSEYLNDIETAARVFCKGFFFADAIRLVVSQGQHQLLETVVDQGLAESMAETTELLADCKSQLNAQVPRIRELRAKKEEDPLAYFEGITSNDIPDNISIAATDTSTSGGSLFTRYTNRTTGSKNTQTTTSRNTSKNRRREERKRARGKKGSIYEEEYLMNSIRRLIERVNSLRDEIRRLREGLLRRRMWARAVAVEKAMLDVVGLCKGCIEEVFVLRTEAKDPIATEKAGLGLELDESLLAAPQRNGPDGGRQPNELIPIVLPFEKLALLDL
ncbi:MAG: hypothetical protein M1823_000607 [Watsoniomyces obsoletus]|nr:MAG: hypothetical protein M1823_000607 [Watsoniomyces obsoletus]